MFFSLSFFYFFKYYLTKYHIFAFQIFYMVKNIKKRLLQLILIGVTIFFNACAPSEQSANSNKSNGTNKADDNISTTSEIIINENTISKYIVEITTNEEKLEDDIDKEENEALLIIADDRSGSTAVNRKLSKDNYEAILNKFATYHSGVIAVRVIGNPKNDNLEFHRLTIKTKLKSLRKIDKLDDALFKSQPTLTEKAKYLKNYNKNYDKINAYNNIINESNKTKMDAFLNKIDDQIIKYKTAGKDITDINDAFSHIHKIATESSFKSYKHVYIFILSDGVHDANTNKVKAFPYIENAQIYLVGWKDLTVFSSYTKDNNLFEKESIEALAPEKLKEIFKN